MTLPETALSRVGRQEDVLELYLTETAGLSRREAGEVISAVLQEGQDLTTALAWTSYGQKRLPAKRLGSPIGYDTLPGSLQRVIDKHNSRFAQ